MNSESDLNSYQNDILEAVTVVGLAAASLQQLRHQLQEKDSNQTIEVVIPGGLKADVLVGSLIIGKQLALVRAQNDLEALVEGMATAVNAILGDLPKKEGDVLEDITKEWSGEGPSGEGVVPIPGELPTQAEEPESGTMEGDADDIEAMVRAARIPV